jgi:hypothetical protein
MPAESKHPLNDFNCLKWKVQITLATLNEQSTFLSMKVDSIVKSLPRWAKNKTQGRKLFPFCAADTKSCAFHSTWELDLGDNHDSIHITLKLYREGGEMLPLASSLLWLAGGHTICAVTKDPISGIPCSVLCPAVLVWKFLIIFPLNLYLGKSSGQYSMQMSTRYTWKKEKHFIS